MSFSAYAVEHEDILSLRFGGLWQTDEYLSPLLYNDFLYGISNQWNQSFRRDSAWSHSAVLSAQYARLYPARKTNYMDAIGLQAGWGAHYHFASLMKVKGLDLILGPYLLFDLMAREHANNVNKPYSMDLSLDLMAQTALSYTLHAKRTAYRLQYEVGISALGLMFVPEYGQSYYEITEGVVRHTASCSSFHNRLLLQQQLSLDMQFRRSTWRIGVRHEYLQYHANNLSFSREQVALVVGTIFHYHLFQRPM